VVKVVRQMTVRKNVFLIFLEGGSIIFFMSVFLYVWCMSSIILFQSLFWKIFGILPFFAMYICFPIVLFHLFQSKGRTFLLLDANVPTHCNVSRYVNIKIKMQHLFLNGGSSIYETWQPSYIDAEFRGKYTHQQASYWAEWCFPALMYSCALRIHVLIYQKDYMYQVCFMIIYIGKIFAVYIGSFAVRIVARQRPSFP
jgi:hypothetical protein